MPKSILILPINKRARNSLRPSKTMELANFNKTL